MLIETNLKMIPMIRRLRGYALEDLRVTFEKVIDHRKSQNRRFLPFLGVFRGSLKTDWQIFIETNLKMIPMILRLRGCPLEVLRVTFEKVIDPRKSRKRDVYRILRFFVDNSKLTGKCCSKPI